MPILNSILNQLRYCLFCLYCVPAIGAVILGVMRYSKAKNQTFFRIYPTGMQEDTIESREFWVNNPRKMRARLKRRAWGIAIVILLGGYLLMLLFPKIHL